jgi:hypothetical protein
MSKKKIELIGRGSVVDPDGKVGIEVVEPPTPMEAAASDTLDALDELVAGIPGGVQVRVKFYRVDPKTRRLAYLWTQPFEPDMDLEETVRARAGGGEIHAIFLYPRGMVDPKTGRGSRTLMFGISGVPRDPNGPEDPAPVAGTGGDVGLRVEMARLQGLVEGMKSQAVAPALDPIALIEKLTTVMRNLQPPPVAPVAPIDPLAQIDKIVGVVEKVVGVGRDIAPEEPRASTDWGHVIDRGVDAVQQLITENRRVTPTAARGADPVERPVALPAGADQVTGWQREVLEWVPRLLGRAQGDKDPGVAAVVFIEDISGGTRAALRGVVTQPDFIEATLTQLAVLVPDLDTHRVWFTEFLTAVVEELKADAPPAPLAIVKDAAPEGAPA